MDAVNPARPELVDEATRTPSSRGRGTKAPDLRALVFPGIWLVFLAFPIVSLIGSEQPSPLIALGTVGIIAFAIAYLAFWVIVDRVPGRESRARRRFVGAAILILAALAAVTVPVIGVAVTSFLAYFVAVLAFSLPLRWSLLPSLALIIGAAAWVIAASQPGWPWQLAGSTVGALIVLVLALVTSQQAEDAEFRARLEEFRTRERIGRDVHDLLGHGLTVIVLKAQLARRSVRSDPDRAEREMDEVLALAQNALAEVRFTVGELRHPDLAGQLDAARTACAAAGVKLIVHGSADAIPSALRAPAAWTLREAVTNLIRHAGARTCTVDLRRTGISIVDDGRGCGDTGPGNGLDGLQRRIADAGGTLRVRAAHPNRDPAGTRVEAVFA